MGFASRSDSRYISFYNIGPMSSPIRCFQYRSALNETSGLTLITRSSPLIFLNLVIS